MPYPEVFQPGPNYRLSRIHEFTFDDILPPMGALLMWEPPNNKLSYTIGVDPSWGIGEDRAAIHVLKNGTMRWKDAQVAEFIADDINMHDLTPICYMLGSLYNNTDEGLEALMAVECNISDDIVHNLRNKYGYKNLFIWKYYDNIKRMMSNKLGWWTNSRTRPKIISKAMHYIKQGWWDIASPWLINELQTLQKLEEKARIEASSGFHDDLVMAGCIALWAAHDIEFNDFGMDGEVAMQRDRRSLDHQAAFEVKQPPLSERKDFINTACSAEEMMEWEPPE